MFVLEILMYQIITGDVKSDYHRLNMYRFMATVILTVNTEQ